MQLITKAATCYRRPHPFADVSDANDCRDEGEVHRRQDDAYGAVAVAGDDDAAAAIDDYCIVADDEGCDGVVVAVGVDDGALVSLKHIRPGSIGSDYSDFVRIERLLFVVGYEAFRTPPIRPPAWGMTMMRPCGWN